MAEKHLMLFVLDSAPPSRFAATEAARYVQLITGRRTRIVAAARQDPNRPGIWLGLARQFPPGADGAPAASGPADPFADSIAIRASPGHVILAGSNPRSIVFAVYRYLEELGCRWLRPGPKGERVPRISDALERRFNIVETPSARHRCLCIEGSCSARHVEALIDYGVKRGFNAYFIQLRNGYPFFRRWYAQERRRGRTPAAFTHQQCDRIRQRVKLAALRRGMALHVIGHGWTCEPLGLRGDDWRPTDQTVPKKVRPLLAMINGKRDLWHQMPVATNLCFSNPAVRRIMADAVVRYVRRHPDEQVVHVWLGDAANNTCECPRCRTQRLSDWYVMILNEIDQRLGATAPDTRIVFLAYFALLWAPTRQRINNPGRFMLMFAPITRSYERSYRDDPGARRRRPGPYRVNRLKFPASPMANFRLLEGWRRAFDGERILFDYHLWGKCLCDPGQIALARVIHQDMRDLRRLGLAGHISCQLQRVAFPTGFALHVMGRTLWDDSLSFARLRDGYFADTFGASGRDVAAYLQRLGRLFSPAFFRGERTGPAARRLAIANLRRVPRLVDKMQPTIDAGRHSDDPATACAWELLDEHAWYSKRLAEVYRLTLERDTSAVEAAEAFTAELYERLPKLHPVLDVRAICERIGGLLRSEGLLPTQAATA